MCVPLQDWLLEETTAEQKPGEPPLRRALPVLVESPKVKIVEATPTPTPEPVNDQVTGAFDQRTDIRGAFIGGAIMVIGLMVLLITLLSRRRPLEEE